MCSSPMTVVTGHIAPVYFVRWLEPAVSDVERIVGEAMALQRAGHAPLHYVAIIGKAVDPPGDDVRASMRHSIDRLLDCCDSIHLVIEGKGFRRAAMRSIGTSIFLLSRYRGRTFAHDSVEDALRRIAKDTSVDPAKILRDAAQRELLSETAVPA
jgi:hypothetical protein